VPAYGIPSIGLHWILVDGFRSSEPDCLSVCIVHVPARSPMFSVERAYWKTGFYFLRVNDTVKFQSADSRNYSVSTGIPNAM
jgi:hypothetical protein